MAPDGPGLVLPLASRSQVEGLDTEGRGRKVSACGSSYNLFFLLQVLARGKLPFLLSRLDVASVVTEDRHLSNRSFRVVVAGAGWLGVGEVLRESLGTRKSDVSGTGVLEFIKLSRVAGEKIRWTPAGEGVTSWDLSGQGIW